MKVSRNVIIGAVSALVIFGSGVAVSQSWHREETRIATEQAAADATKAREARMREQRITDAIDRVNGSCDAQVAYYDTVTARMTAIQKRTVPTPACQEVKL
jgi:hypothetical protein